MEDSLSIVKMVQMNIKVSEKQKRKLQDLANLNTDGDLTALIKMLADGKEIKR